MQLRGIHHVAVQVRDVARVAGFYVEVLGLPELRRFLRDDGSLRSIWVGTDGSFLAVEQLEGEGHGPMGFSMLAFRIDAAQRRQIVEELGRRGVAIEKQTGWTLYVRDPEHNLVGLSHHPDDDQGAPVSETR